MNMDENMEENMYCGIGNIPKGKTRGTPEYCVRANQVRYYGLEKIDKKILKEAKGKTTDLIKEQLKFKKIEDDAKSLIKDVKNIKIILEDESAKPTQLKNAQKKMDELLIKRDKLIKKLKDQKKVVENLEKQEKKSAKPTKSKYTKSKSTKSSSGSKTKKRK